MKKIYEVRFVIEEDVLLEAINANRAKEGLLALSQIPEEGDDSLYILDDKIHTVVDQEITRIYL